MRNSGEYNKYMDWIKATSTQDELGGNVRTWTVNGQLWCAVQSLMSALQNNQGANRNQIDAIIYISGIVAIAGEDRLRYNGQVWEIQSFYVDEDEDEVVCDCIRIEMDDSDIVS